MKRIWKVIIILGVLGSLTSFAGIVGYLAYKTSMFGDTIMVIPVKGLITMDGCDVGLLSMPRCTTVQEVRTAFEQANADSRVKVIFLDVNSGGGSVVASREMMRVVRSSQKPVVSWIGEAGASGAYYVVSASDYIVADQDSLMGSIGVIMSLMHYYDLMADIGVNVTVIKSGKVKDIGSPYRPMTEDEKEIMQEMVDEIYNDFAFDVSENRDLPLEHVQNISDGSLYLGREALNLGLIDRVGGYDEALEVAKNIGGIEGEAKIIRPERQESLFELINKLYGFKYPGFHNMDYKNQWWYSLWAT